MQSRRTENTLGRRITASFTKALMKINPSVWLGLEDRAVERREDSETINQWA